MLIKHRVKCATGLTFFVSFCLCAMTPGYASESSLTVLVKQNGAAPNSAGVMDTTFDRLGAPILNDKGEAAFVGWLANNKAGYFKADGTTIIR